MHFASFYFLKKLLLYLECKAFSVVFFLWDSFCRHWWFTLWSEKWAKTFYSSLPFSSTQECSDRYFYFWIWDDYLLLLNLVHVITRPLWNEIYQPLEISKFISFVDIMSDLIPQFLKDRWWILTRFNYKGNDQVRKLATPVLPIFVLRA